MVLSNIKETFRKLDAYSKPLEDFRVKTFSGAIVTLVSSAIMILLFVSELRDYLGVQVSEELFVDTSRIPKIKINFDVVFPQISCEFLGVDAIDSSGEQQIGVDHNVYKRKLDLEGKPLQEPEADTINKIEATTLKPANDTVAEVLCGSCYGAREGCCNTCADVREAYRFKNWAFQPENFEQCRTEKDSRKNSDIFKEGCQLYGYLEVNRVSGSFHIAPGKSFSVNHVHVHDVQPYSSDDFNITHRIRHLSFGRQIMGREDPLDETLTVAEKGSMMFQYYIKIVPVTYVRLDGSQFFTNQYSVTRHQKVVSMMSGDSGVPGVFFSYELSPLMVRYSEKQRSLGHFATDVCAIIGGVFTVASLVDAFLYRSSRLLREKLQLGKAT